MERRTMREGSGNTNRLPLTTNRCLMPVTPCLTRQLKSGHTTYSNCPRHKAKYSSPDIGEVPRRGGWGTEMGYKDEILG